MLQPAYEEDERTEDLRAQSVERLHLREIACALVRLEAFTRQHGFLELAERIDAAVTEADGMLTSDESQLSVTRSG